MLSTVHCEPGFFSMDNSTCTACPLGTYKNISGIMECKKCDEGFTTEATGRITVAECFISESQTKNLPYHRLLLIIFISIS